MPSEPFHAYDPAAGRVLTLRVLAPGEGRVPGRIYLEQVAAEPLASDPALAVVTAAREYFREVELGAPKSERDLLLDRLRAAVRKVAD